ncbi:hypothetical protein QA612_13835 [Evansella sp. AB-P1]|uniref:hypothetical protein n=1 Tax=Evansella sp. AB-P1 TaxID=3037653 RepID=UPI00241F20BF|nr:hypothetical protein [Evansella sp. AB-P1]MDG5788562.1 hypothetical protein [Evansella sp. AB-P1]
MARYYIAVTYDVCEHNKLYEDMNEYHLDSSADFEKQIREFAKTDFAPLVKVYESDTRDFEEIRLYKEYNFKEYECGCYQ